MESCGSSFNRADNLRNHMKVKHNLGTNTKQARFSCPVETCKKSFFHATKLIDHLKEHNMDVGKITQKLIIYIHG